MNPKESTQEEENITKETKQNNMILSAWEDRFSDDQWKRRISSNKRKKRNRRSSSIFSPASRTSLDSDRANQNIARNEKKSVVLVPKPRNSFACSATETNNSPSDAVAPHLASLHMSPPNTDSEEQATSTTPMPAAGRAGEQPTWDFIADLGTINSKGAMELSPKSSNTGRTKLDRACVICETSRTKQSTTIEENGSPGQNEDLDSINSFGAAFDNYSPNQKEQLKKDGSANSSSLSLCIGFLRQNPNESTNTISKALLHTPELDQEWDFATLLTNLSLSMMRRERIRTSLTMIDPPDVEILSCANVLMQEVRRMLASKSESREQTSIAKSRFVANKVILSEWLPIEISFLAQLTSVVERSEVEIVKQTKILEASITELPDCVPRSSPTRSTEQIEREISELRAKIGREKSSCDIIDACTAPRACILCQATAQMGLYGFCFEELKDDHVLKLKFLHSIFGVTTHVMFDLNSDPGVVIGPITSPSDSDNSCMLDFHRRHLDMLADGEISVPMDSSSLQDSLLKLGLFLGKLDQSARTFKVINDEGKAIVTFDSPHVLLQARNNGIIVRLTLTPENLVTKAILVYKRNGRGYEVKEHEGVSSIDCSDLNSLQKIVSRYT